MQALSKPLPLLRKGKLSQSVPTWLPKDIRSKLQGQAVTTHRQTLSAMLRMLVVPEKTRTVYVMMLAVSWETGETENKGPNEDYSHNLIQEDLRNKNKRDFECKKCSL